MRYIIFGILIVMAFIILSPAVKAAGSFLMKSWYNLMSDKTNKIVDEKQPSTDEHQDNSV